MKAKSNTYFVKVSYYPQVDKVKSGVVDAEQDLQTPKNSDAKLGESNPKSKEKRKFKFKVELVQHKYVLFGWSF